MKTTTQQLELFSGLGQAGQGSGLKSNTFLGYIRGYERIIILAIGFIITAVVSFSLGVEKGRRLALKSTASRFDIALSSKVIPAQKPEAGYLQDKPRAINPSQENYTIQLASYQNKAFAQRQAGILKKKGLTTLVISKGSYTILCVGSFHNQETAKPLLSQLRKKYQDSFIRRL